MDYGEYASSTRGSTTILLEDQQRHYGHGTQMHLNTSGGARTKTQRQQKQTSKDQQSGRARLAGEDIRTDLMDQGRRADHIDYEVMKNIGKAVTDSKGSSVG